MVRGEAAFKNVAFFMEFARFVFCSLMHARARAATKNWKILSKRISALVFPALIAIYSPPAPPLEVLMSKLFGFLFGGVLLLTLLLWQPCIKFQTFSTGFLRLRCLYFN